MCLLLLGKGLLFPWVSLTADWPQFFCSVSCTSFSDGNWMLFDQEKRALLRFRRHSKVMVERHVTFQYLSCHRLAETLKDSNTPIIKSNRSFFRRLHPTLWLWTGLGYGEWAVSLRKESSSCHSEPAASCQSFGLCCLAALFPAVGPDSVAKTGLELLILLLESPSWILGCQGLVITASLRAVIWNGIGCRKMGSGDGEGSTIHACSFS